MGFSGGMGEEGLQVRCWGQESFIHSFIHSPGTIYSLQGLGTKGRIGPTRLLSAGTMPHAPQHPMPSGSPRAPSFPTSLGAVSAAHPRSQLHSEKPAGTHSPCTQKGLTLGVTTLKALIILFLF